MKKGLLITAVVLAAVAGGAWYTLSGAGGFIKEQIEVQGSKYLGTQVTVFNVDLALTDGRMTITDIDIENPAGFSPQDAFSMQAITLDLGNITGEPYVVQTINVDAPEVLYEVDAGGKANLLVLKDNVMANIPASDAPEPEPTATGPSPLVIIEDIVVSNVRLQLNFEKLETGGIDLGEKAYEITLPTFSAGSVGAPNGIPADQAGAAIAQAMLDNIIKSAKAEVKRRAKEKAKEKLEAEKDKLLDKASDKLGELFKK